MSEPESKSALRERMERDYLRQLDAGIKYIKEKGGDWNFRILGENSELYEVRIIRR